MTLAAYASVVRGAPGIPDKYDLQPSDSHLNNGNGAYSANGSYPGWRNTNGRTQVDATLINGQKTLTIICVGQSNMCSVAPTPYVPSNSLAHNLNIYDGGVYRLKDPPLGCSQTTNGVNIPSGANGAWLSRLADKLINAGSCARAIMVPAGHAGSWVGDWDPAASTPNHYTRIKVALLRCAALGLTPDAIIWMQGENDAGSGTSQTTYQTILGRVIAQSRTDGYSGPWFVNVQTLNGGTHSATIAAAQAAIVNHASGIWAGANCDSLGSANWQADQGHFNDTGMDAVATLMLSALQAYGAPF